PRHSAPLKPPPLSAKNSTRLQTVLVMRRPTRTKPAGNKHGTTKCGSLPVAVHVCGAAPATRCSCCQGIRSRSSKPRGQKSWRKTRNGASSFHERDCCTEAHSEDTNKNCCRQCDSSASRLARRVCKSASSALGRGVSSLSFD